MGWEEFVLGREASHHICGRCTTDHVSRADKGLCISLRREPSDLRSASSVVMTHVLYIEPGGRVIDNVKADQLYNLCIILALHHFGLYEQAV